jgi:ribonuclease P protein component
VRLNGKTYAHPLVVLVVAPNELQQVRIGVVASRSFGKAVDRNRAKRRLRACLSTLLERLSGGRDFIFLARRPLNQAGFTEVCAAVKVVLKKAGVLDERG